MTSSPKCYAFISKEESTELHAYQDSAGIWTIGTGTIKYEDGTPVKKGDRITAERALELLKHEVSEKEAKVRELTKGVALNQNQFDALVSFAYNVGTGALAGSTLLKRVKANPCDPTIREAFMMWNKITDPKTGKKVPLLGLTKRRGREADLYFSSAL